MQKHAMWKTTALFVIGAFAAACSDASGPGAQLSQEEAAAVGGQFVGAAAGGVAAGVGTGLSPSPAANLAAPPVERSFSFTHSRTCPGGGTLEVSGSMEGTIDRENRSGTITSEATIVATDCVVMHRDRTFTINTVDPGITKMGQIAIENGDHSGELTINGQFTWVDGEGVSGTCTIDVTVTITPDGRTRTGGKVCERDMDPGTT